MDPPGRYAEIGENTNNWIHNLFLTTLKMTPLITWLFKGNKNIYERCV